MNVVIYSIPGSGTRFASSFLEDCLELELTSVESLLFDICRNKFACLHVGEHLKKAVMVYGSDLKVIIPLRSPALQYLSRRKQAGNVDHLRNRTIYEWATLINVMHHFRERHVFLPLETMHRKETLLEVIDLLGTTFKRDELNRYAEKWPMVGHNQNPPAGHYSPDEMAGHLNFAEEWYNKQLEAHDGRYS